VQPQLIAQLLSDLKHDEKPIRWNAAQSLALIEEPPKGVIEALKEALRDTDDDIRTIAAYRLAMEESPPEEAIEPIWQDFQNEKLTVGRNVWDCIGRFTDAPYRVLPLLCSNNTFAEKELAFKLKEFRVPVLPALETAWRDETARRYSALNLAMVHCGGVHHVLESLRNSEDEHAPRIAAHALGRCRAEDEEVAVSALIGALSDSRRNVRQTATVSLIDLCFRQRLRDRIIPPLLEAMVADPSIRELVNLSRIVRGEDGFLVYLVDDVAKKSASLRAMAATVLGTFPRPRNSSATVLGPLRRWKEDDDAEVRTAAERALHKLGWQ
jgi:hypothetical protein